MVYYRRVVKKRPACLTDEEMQALAAAAKKWEDHFRARDGVDVAPASVRTVLCPWCRERHSPVEVDVCMALPRKTAAAGPSGSSTSKPLDAGLLSEYSELWAFLTAVSYPDGTKRRTGRLSLSSESDLLGLLLTDDETGQYAFLNGRSYTDLLMEAELRLSDGTLSWRPSRYGLKGRKG